jgi:hypothetical protein
VTSSQIYRYFADKEALVRAMPGLHHKGSPERGRNQVSELLAGERGCVVAWAGIGFNAPLATPRLGRDNDQTRPPRQGSRGARYGKKQKRDGEEAGSGLIVFLLGGSDSEPLFGQRRTVAAEGRLPCRIAGRSGRLVIRRAWPVSCAGRRRVRSG